MGSEMVQVSRAWPRQREANGSGEAPVPCRALSHIPNSNWTPRTTQNGREAGGVQIALGGDLSPKQCKFQGQ